MRLVEMPTLASVGKSTQKRYSGKWNTWLGVIKAEGKGP